MRTWTKDEICIIEYVARRQGLTLEEYLIRCIIAVEKKNLKALATIQENTELILRYKELLKGE